MVTWSGEKEGAPWNPVRREKKETPGGIQHHSVDGGEGARHCNACDVEGPAREDVDEHHHLQSATFAKSARKLAQPTQTPCNMPSRQPIWKNGSCSVNVAGGLRLKQTAGDRGKRACAQVTPATQWWWQIMNSCYQNRDRHS